MRRWLKMNCCTAKQKEVLLSSNIEHFPGDTKQLQRRSCVQWAELIQSAIRGNTSCVFVLHSSLLSITLTLFFLEKNL